MGEGEIGATLSKGLSLSLLPSRLPPPIRASFWGTLPLC